ncbi:alpha/beta hydrolase [Actinopolymorpha sp. B17G11]|uniref:alpha/beta fold hydrolase n=1 Tax=unclassified Actinopolymorpha TaxID=2627063 RepID=UPI0032D9AB4F
MATYVLVAGNWLGGWAWADVTRHLRAAGHDAHPVTLTGVGDRVHLASSTVDLDTHISDVVHTMEYENLHDVILVGHSYGGFPVTGAADKVPDRLARVVYVDSGPLPDGSSQLDTLGPEGRDAILARMGADPDDGWREPLPTWAAVEADGTGGGLDEAAWARIAARATAQPLGANAQPLHLVDDKRRNAIPHTLITCLFPLEQVRAMIAAKHPFFAAFTADQDWSYAELPTGHWPMFSEPEQLARILDDLSGR